MHIAVLGAGNTGQIMAFDLTRKGAAVRLYTSRKAVAEVLSRDGIEATGVLEGRERPSLVTTDLGAAVRGCEVIVIMTTAGGHRPVAEALKPHLAAGQVVVVFNANWGALEVTEVLAAGGGMPDVLVGETGTQLYIGTVTGPGTVFAKQIKQRVTLAMTDPAMTEGVLARLAPFLPQLTRAGSVLETSLSSANAVVHTPVCLFNLSRIELGQDFLFYSEGASASVVTYVDKVDQERMGLMHALGLPARGMLEILNSFWPDKRATLYDAIHENPSYRTVKGPKSLAHRFLTEDIPYGIVPQVHLGRCLGVPMPYTEAMLEAFDRFLGPELAASGFRPEAAGLARFR